MKRVPEVDQQSVRAGLQQQPGALHMVILDCPEDGRLFGCGHDVHRRRLLGQQDLKQKQTRVLERGTKYGNVRSAQSAKAHMAKKVAIPQDPQKNLDAPKSARLHAICLDNS